MNIADRIEGSGRTWTAYMEDMPTACATADSGLYAVHHNPFIYYQDISGNQTRCNSHVVPFTRFATDLTANRLSNFVWITPGLCHDGHDCSLDVAGAWLDETVSRITSSNAWRSSGVLFVVWDEGDGGDNNLVPLIVLTKDATAMRVETQYDHYSLLATIEDLYGLPRLGAARTARPLAQLLPMATH